MQNCQSFHIHPELNNVQSVPLVFYLTIINANSDISFFNGLQGMEFQFGSALPLKSCLQQEIEFPLGSTPPIKQCESVSLSKTFEAKRCAF